jgi:hypothetical protein
MDEMYSMLGREHQADLEREAVRRRRAAEVRERPGADGAAPNDRRLQKLAHAFLAGVAAFVSRTARVEA